MPKVKAPKTGAKVVTLRPGNGQIIRINADPARDEALRNISRKLFSARAALNCIQRAIHHSDANDTCEDVTLADIALVDVMLLLEKLHEDIDVFDRDHLRKTRGVAS